MLVPLSEGDAPRRAVRRSTGGAEVEGAKVGKSQQLLGEAAFKKDDFIQRGQLETINMYSFRYLEARIPKSNCQQGYPPSRGAEGKSDPCLLQPWGALGILASWLHHFHMS